jgi:hypothetical protein
MKKILGFLFFVVLLAGCKTDTSSPKGTVNAFIEAMKKGDLETVKKLITKSDVSMLNFAESMAKNFGSDKNMSEKIKTEFIEKSKTVSYAVKDEKVDGNNAEVYVEIKENDKTTTQPFKLVKEDGSWKISLISTGFNAAGNDQNGNNLENINIADSLKKGMEQLKNMNMDSLNRAMKERMDKLKELKEKNPEMMKQMEEQMKKMQEQQPK